MPVLSPKDYVRGQPEGKDKKPESFSEKFPFFILTISVVQVTNIYVTRPFTFRVTLINPSAFLDLLILLREK